MAKSGRKTEYKVKKVRLVAWVHPKTRAELEKTAARRNVPVGKVLDEQTAAKIS